MNEMVVGSTSSSNYSQKGCVASTLWFWTPYSAVQHIITQSSDDTSPKIHTCTTRVCTHATQRRCAIIEKEFETQLFLDKSVIINCRKCGKKQQSGKEKESVKT